MRAMLLTSLAAVAVVVFAMPTAALADDCEATDTCGPPPPPPAAPRLDGTGTAEGHYRVFTSPTSDERFGSVNSRGQASFSGGGGSPAIVDGDGTVHDGYSGSNISLRFTTPPADASAATTSSAAATFSSIAVVNNGYLVELHAQNAAAYAALTPLLGTSGAIASIHGNYSLSASGMAYGYVSATTGGGDGVGGFTLDPALQKSFSLTCDFSGYYDTTGSGCLTGGYTLDLNFTAGSTFADGNPLSIYGTISLNAQTHAGTFSSGSGDAGTASAFIDPTITLNSLFNNPLYSLNVGNAITPYVGGAVPEPASWALMLVGFGLTGRAARRAARKAVLA